MSQERRRGPAQGPNTAYTDEAMLPRGTHRSRTTELGQSLWFANGTVEQRRRYAQAVATARETARRNRQLVLSHADLCEALVERLGYERPDQWHGYIPPRFYEAGDDVGPPRWLPNQTPARLVLLELVATAEARGAP